MSTDQSTHATSQSVRYETIQSISKLLLGTIALLAFVGLVSVLPGVDRVIPGTPITVMAIVSFVATIAVVGLLLVLAPGLAELVRSTLDGPQQVVDDIASVVHLFVVLVAVLVAHSGMAPAITPLLEGATWVYDVVFFAIALPPLAILAARVYVSLDPMSELLADRVAGPDTNADAASNASTANPDDSTATPTDDESEDTTRDQRAERRTVLESTVGEEGTDDADERGNDTEGESSK
ncbi:hypothetical protein C483_17663 [Natrialba hulunbeirensis JCM 10989]|uniref:Uncharacterized protein n=1 Tax=Natrialba hulunbeirensis JCM 10989 TaxID=1227493 RepID=L9ZRG9_9EURY|nr:hypothetical protein [Natrialba hulunbeirensis]ELY87748.1 hypothetical protein C483_17663 [Natrialba hulunbeirensis JCM 10989]